MEDQTPSTFLLEFNCKSGKDHLNLYMDNTLIGGINSISAGIDLVEKCVSIDANIINSLEKTTYTERADATYLSASSENSSIVISISTDDFSFRTDSDLNVVSTLDVTKLSELLIEKGPEQEKASVHAIYTLH